MIGKWISLQPLQLTGVREFLLEARVRAVILRRMGLARVKQEKPYALGGEVGLQLIELRHLEGAHRAGHSAGHHHHMTAAAKVAQPDDLSIQRLGFELRRGGTDLCRQSLARIGDARPSGELC